MKDYYSENLAGERLRFCYEIAPLRIQQYLNAEIEFVGNRLISSDLVLELGCGYGRVMKFISPEVETLVGIDTSFESIQLAKRELGEQKNCKLFIMNAAGLGFRSKTFDCVFCIQNGISAFKVDQLQLIKEALRVTRKGGFTVFSSYSEKFWQERLNWFRMQAERGLVGDIDEEVTGDGIIACKDGFRSTNVNAEEFRSLIAQLNVKAEISEVDESSVFCEIEVM